VCLLEVIKFNAGLYCSLSKLAGAFDSGLDTIQDENAKELVEIASSLTQNILPGLRQDAEAAGMPLVVIEIDQIITQHKNGRTPAKTLREMKELNERIIDSLGAIHFVRIPESQVELFDKPHLGWDWVIDKFPETATAIEEASKSLALGRDTACVFHLMGVMQCALNALAKSLGTKIDLNTATWNTILEGMQKAVTTKQANTKKKTHWKLRLEPFYSEVLSDLKAVKNAWRNPTMHFWRTYTEEEARKTYERVREFSVMVARGPISYGQK